MSGSFWSRHSSTTVIRPRLAHEFFACFGHRLREIDAANLRADGLAARHDLHVFGCIRLSLCRLGLRICHFNLQNFQIERKPPPSTASN